MGTTTPVAFIVFNRPEVTRQTFERIREAEPERLLIVADGPRPSHPTDGEQCAEVREIVARVDWPCEVERVYAEQNLGCKRRVSSGLDHVFQQVERAIIIEDDCVPHPDFFPYCTELLARYEDDERVAAITGDNFQQGIERGDASYYFSKYVHIWGWATWRRSWQHYDGDISFWAQWKKSEEWHRLMSDPVERRYWERIAARVHRGEIDTWDYPWIMSVWFNGGLTATPNVNLVSNVGFGAEATHTKGDAWFADLDTGGIGTLAHPNDVLVDTDADEHTFDHHYGGADLRARRRPAGFAKWLLTGVGRRLAGTFGHRD